MAQHYHKIFDFAEVKIIVMNDYLKQVYFYILIISKSILSVFGKTFLNKSRIALIISYSAHESILIILITFFN